MELVRCRLKCIKTFRIRGYKIKKYEVEIKNMDIYHVPVEAKDKVEAADKAYAILDKEDKMEYYFDSLGDCIVFAEGKLI
ncbi:MAG: hypothetical protein ACTSXG_01560 [Alphaproteobacteria bacterium]